MKEPWIQKLRRFIRNPIPRRVETRVATFWEWNGRNYRIRRKDGRLTAPPAPPSDTAADCPAGCLRHTTCQRSNIRALEDPPPRR